ncbi:MAG: hypothetical protein PHH37_13660 [Paludibacter sp.]|nr:hypothetical protein [Paludibacter sp.]
MRYSSKIAIAGFELSLNSEVEISLEEGYYPFKSQSNKTPDVEIACYAGISEALELGEAVFVAENESQRFYAIYQTGKELTFLIYNQQEKGKIQQLAVLSSDLKHWTIYTDLLSNGKINPLRYPMGPLIMQYLTVNSEAVMIHAACVTDGKTGQLFAGFSGRGKSTMAKIWKDVGYQVINDDRIIIRRQGEEFVAYNTPMYYADVPKSTVLRSIFLIRHFPENKIRKIEGAIAVSKVLAFCIQNNFSQSFIVGNLAFLSKMIQTVNVYELGFVPDNHIIDFVIDNG